MPLQNTVYLGGFISGVHQQQKVNDTHTVMRFSVAYNPPWAANMPDEQRKEHTAFIPCEQWVKNEGVASWNNRFAKSKPIYLMGTLAMDQWEDKDSKENRTRRYVKVTAAQKGQPGNFNFCMVLINGNLTENPALEHLGAKRSAHSRFMIGHNDMERTKGDGTKYTPEPVFYSIDVWEKQADKVCEYLQKGSGVFIVGELQTPHWVKKVAGKDENRSDLTIRAGEFGVRFTGKKKGEADGSDGEGSGSDQHGEDRGERGFAPPRATSRSGLGTPPPVQDHVDEDVPF